MKNEKCEKIMNSFLELDKNQRIPFNVTRHLLVCKKCRTQIRLCTLAEKASSKPLNTSLPLDNQTLISIMNQIDAKYVTKSNKVKHVSLLNWVIIGILMLVALLTYGISTGSLNSTILVVPFYLCFAGIVCVYCALFVGSNLDYFVKKFNTIPRKTV